MSQEVFVIVNKIMQWAEGLTVKKEMINVRDIDSARPWVNGDTDTGMTVIYLKGDLRKRDDKMMGDDKGRKSIRIKESMNEFAARLEESGCKVVKLVSMKIKSNQ